MNGSGARWPYRTFKVQIPHWRWQYLPSPKLWSYTISFIFTSRMNVWKESLEQNKAAKVRDQLIIMLEQTVLLKLQNHIGFTWHLKIVIAMITSQRSFGEV